MFIFQLIEPIHGLKLTDNENPWGLSERDDVVILWFLNSNIPDGDQSISKNVCLIKKPVLRRWIRVLGAIVVRFFQGKF